MNFFVPIPPPHPALKCAMGLNYHKILKGGLWLPTSFGSEGAANVTEISEKLSKVLADLKVRKMFKA